jgi:hypothetical protein
MRIWVLTVLLALSVTSSLASTPEPGVQPPPAVLPGVNADPTIVVFGNGYNCETCLSPLRFDDQGRILAVEVYESASLRE